MGMFKKTIYTLNLNPEEFAPVTALTYPLIKAYAEKIRADFVEIKDRKFPDWPVNYEKLQIYQLGQEARNDWNIFIDMDALVHPDTIDYSNHLGKDTVAHNGADMASMRFVYDRFFLRDGRNIGSATWMCWASDWCIELFEPIKDMTPAEVGAIIYPTVGEIKRGVLPIRLVEDFVMGRNIARYGLKFTTLIELHRKLGIPDAEFFFHLYAIPIQEKVEKMKETLARWGLL